MASDYLHNHKDFSDLLNIISSDTKILVQLIEKDYWIMHVLFGLKQQGFEFELKGGTSLSKGYKIIDRFSEDIDIHIKPSADLKVETNPRKTKDSHIQSRKNYYDWLMSNIQIDGIISITRDIAFDNEKTYNSGGIRLNYQRATGAIEGLKEGILLEVGFDTVTPNKPLAITSWAFEKANTTKGIDIIDNRALEIPCYHPGYTFVEKLQTIATKFRQEQTSRIERPNLMRQYYDVYCLLSNEDVQKFIGTKEYLDHKKARFPRVDFDIPIAQNEAYLLSNPELRARFKKRYQDTSSLYYKSQPAFEELLATIAENINML
jgi:predicted nucleotidyltransferase component of viral defense system